VRMSSYSLESVGRLTVASNLKACLCRIGWRLPRCTYRFITKLVHAIWPEFRGLMTRRENYFEAPQCDRGNSKCSLDLVVSHQVVFVPVSKYQALS
jgi:hypothetical protein